MQRHLPHHQLLGAGDFRPGDAALGDDFHPLGARLHRPQRRLPHRPPVGHPPAELVGNALAHQVGIHFRLLNLNDIQPQLPAGHRLQLGPQALYPVAVPPDENARPRRVNVDDRLLRRPVNLNPGNARVGKPGVLLLHRPAQGQILAHAMAVLGAVVGVPVGFPVLDDAQPETEGVRLMPHLPSPPLSRPLQ